MGRRGAACLALAVAPAGGGRVADGVAEGPNFNYFKVAVKLKVGNLVSILIVRYTV